MWTNKCFIQWTEKGRQRSLIKRYCSRILLNYPAKINLLALATVFDAESYCRYSKNKKRHWYAEKLMKDLISRTIKQFKASGLYDLKRKPVRKSTVRTNKLKLYAKDFNAIQSNQLEKWLRTWVSSHNDNASVIT